MEINRYPIVIAGAARPELLIVLATTSTPLRVSFWQLMMAPIAEVVEIDAPKYPEGKAIGMLTRAELNWPNDFGHFNRAL